MGKGKVEGKKFLITGGSGFIGSNIARYLVNHNAEIRIIDNFSSGRRSNLSDIISNITLIEGDIRDLTTVKKAVEGVDFVLHQAALPSVPRSIESPVTTSEVNINGTLNMLLASKDAGVQKFLYASSSSIYGDSDVLPKVETLPNNPLSPYAVAKMSGEEYCKVFNKVYGLKTVMLRYFNVFGPYQDPNSEYSAVIPKFINMMLDQQTPEIHGDGEQSRDFTYIDNVVHANIKAATEDFEGGMVMNCACNESATLNRLFEIIRKELNFVPNPKYVSSRVGDVKHSLADISRIRQLTGYEPVVKFEEGIKKTIQYYKELRG